MRFEEFVKKAEEQMQEWLGADAQVRVKTVRKNNGVVCTGLHDAAREVGAIIYLEPIYQSYQQSGETEKAFGRAMEDIKEQYGKADGGEEIRQLADAIGDFAAVKEKLAFRLVSRARNRELLQEVPHVNFLDLAVVFELYVGDDGEGVYSVPITNEHMAVWEVDTERLYRIAKANAPVLKPACLQGIGEVLGLGLPEGEQEILYVLTNKQAVHGAAVMLYEGELRKVSDRLGGDLAILPSSLHEVLLAPWTGRADSRGLREIVRNVNRTEVPDEEQLSDQVYRYIRSEDRIEIAE